MPHHFKNQCSRTHVGKFFCVRQVVNILGFRGQLASVAISQFHCYWVNAAIYINEWAWLHFNKILFTKMNGANSCNRAYLKS